MVSVDDKAFLLTYVRNCFVTGDDSGVCELLCPRERITTSELETILSGKGCIFPPEKQGRHSPEIPTNYEKVSRRQSAAESRFMQNKLEKEKRSRIKQTFLQLEPTKQLTAEDVDELFPIEDQSSRTSEEEQVKEKTETRVSLLSQLLSETEVQTNPFADYAVYDGSSTGMGEENARAMHNFQVYLWHLPVGKREIPITVKPAWNTTVAQFVGLVAWKYTVENREPSLNGLNLDDYDVYMFDDEDDLNSGFPPFSRGDHIYKYEFSSLALMRRQKAVEKCTATSESSDQIMVKIHLTQGSSSMLFPQSTKLRDLLAKTVHRRKLKDYDGGYAYRLESKSSPGESVDLDATLESIGITEFCLVRENSRQIITSTSTVHEPTGTQQMMAEILESLEVQHYKVMQKGVINRDVLISVSGEKVEIEYVSKPTKLFRRKPMLYQIDSIQQCRILTQSSGPRCVFKLVHCSEGASSIQFEAPRVVAEAICRQVKNILYFRGANDSVSSTREKKGSISGTL